MVFYNINEWGSETEKVNGLKDKLHISIICIEFGVLEPYEMSGIPDHATLLIASYFEIKTREVPLFLWIISILNETIHLILTTPRSLPRGVVRSC